MSHGLSLTLLGAPHVTLDAAPLRGFVSAKAQALLFYLAVTRRPHTRATLANLLWGEMPDADARANLRVALGNLRQLVGPYLAIGRDQVGLDLRAHCCSDVERFQAGVAQLGPAPSPCQTEALRAAVELYQGDFLEGFSVRDGLGFEEWALLQREHLRQIALQGLHLLASSAGERGAFAEAIGYANRLLALDPWREETHRQLMELLALSGQRQAALAQYETCRRVLARELGVEPLEATAALYQRIRAEHGAARSGPPGPSSLVGRADEHAWLASEWERARQTGPRLTLVEGEAGVGKTRLTEELLGYLGDALVLRGHCQRFGSALPFQPIAAALRSGLATQATPPDVPTAWMPALARLLPELDCRAPAAPPDEPRDETARLRLFEAVARMLVALSEASTPPRPLVLFLDDLHQADQASLDLLGFLVERLAARPVWFLAAYRPEELGWDHPLLALRHALGRAGALAMLELAPLGEAAVAALVAQLAGLAPSEQALLVAHLAQRSCGSPFLLTHLLRDLEQRRVLLRAGGRWHMPDPAALEPAGGADIPPPFSVREQVLERIGRLSAGARAVLERLALLEHDCEPEQLQAFAADVPGLGTCLGECLERRLLTFQQPGGYRFAHPITRQVLRASLRPDQRQRLLALLAALEQPGRPHWPQTLGEPALRAALAP